MLPTDTVVFIAFCAFLAGGISFAIYHIIREAKRQRDREAMQAEKTEPQRLGESVIVAAVRYERQTGREIHSVTVLRGETDGRPFLRAKINHAAAQD